ncbi:MAG TPA: hypothetical protein ENL18_00375 [Thermoplasmatales archaeon]|nr:hypothetical protein [Thermoplasmatales archaeon]
MKTITILAAIAILSLAVTQASAFDVTWSPEHPAPGDKITVNLSPGSNVSNVTIQVCVGDICRLPQPMEKAGDEYTYSFYVSETADVHLNFTIKYTNGSSTWDDTTRFKVEKSGNGSPGFGSVIAVSAAAAAVLLVRKKRTKN